MQEEIGDLIDVLVLILDLGIQSETQKGLLCHIHVIFQLRILGLLIFKENHSRSFTKLVESLEQKFVFHGFERAAKLWSSLKDLANSEDSFTLDISGGLDHPPSTEYLSLDFEVAELGHLLVDLVRVESLNEINQVSSLSPIFGDLLNLSCQNSHSLGLFDVLVPFDPNVGKLVSASNVMVEVSDLNLLVDMSPPSVEDLE